MFKHIVFTALYIFLYAVDVPVNLQYALIAHTLVILYGYFSDRKMPDPLAAYALYILLTTVSNVLMIMNVEAGTVGSYYNYLVPEKLNIAAMIWCIGNTAFFVGMEMTKKTTFPRIDQDVTTTKKVHTIFRVMIVVVLIKGFLIKQLFLGSLGGILEIFSSMGLIFFARLWGATGNNQYKKYTLTLFTIQTIMSVLFSFLRFEMIAPLVCMLMGYMLGQKSLKVLTTAYIVPIILMFAAFNLFFDTFGAQRTEVGSGFARITDMRNAQESVSIYSDATEKQNIMDRASVLPQLTSLVNLVDERGFYNGETIQSLLIALIPRFLWPEKPIIGLGGWFATEIGQGRKTDTWYSNSINMTIPGHLYLDFAWIGVIMGCLLMGIFINCIWNSTAFYNSPYNITGIILGGYLLFASISGMGADLQISITLLSYYLILLVLKKAL